MQIDKARQLKRGDIVACPPDRGNPGYRGTIKHVGAVEAKTTEGTPYIWVTVQAPWRHAEVWPSNRLSL